jgi:hypothetical protein
MANTSRDPISKNPSQKRTGGIAQSVGSEFKRQYQKEKKQKQTNSKHLLSVECDLK